MHEYSQADLTRLFHLSKTLLRLLVKAGYITRPARTGKTRYSFQDLLTLRTASALQGARIPAAKIAKALGNLRANVSPGAMLSTLMVSSSGKDLVVREGAQTWEVSSGQFALPLEATRAASVSNLSRGKRAGVATEDAHAHYARGSQLEGTDLAAARAAYLAALDLQSDHIEARINLGRLLHLAGELEAAEKIYRQAKSANAILSYNLAILLEDMNREAEATAAYREALAQDPQLHDAHFNLSRLYERNQQPREALRHLLAYRRHVLLFGE
ncbi:MAG TPA: tetratricopeptide repeat protein [Steroidobacteraceae bacterium]|nr:tetratricopeptide repeat protein [Steroidobacteraceae bacterium]